MARIVVTEFVSLDGVMEDPGGAEGFRHGGWAFQFSRGEEGDRFKADETMQSDAMLLGRRTYEGFPDTWPSRTGECGDRLNTRAKNGVSPALRDPQWGDTTVLDGDVPAAVAKLREGRGGDIVVHGSA